MTSVSNVSARFLALTIALVSFCVYTSTASAAGIVTLTFDDGSLSQIQTALPVLKAKAQNAVFYVNSGNIGEDTFMTWTQVINLHTTGHEIAAHTVNHIELPTVPIATMSTEVNQDYDTIAAQGIVTTDFASPFGAYDNNMLSIVAKRFNSHRAFANQGLNVWPYNKYVLYVHYVTNQTSEAQAQAWVNQAIAQDAWLIMVFHEIFPTVDPTDDYSWQTAKFQTFLDFLNSKGIKAKTVQQVLAAFTPVNTNPSFENGLTGWTTDNPNAITLDTANNGSYPAPKNSLKFTGATAGAHLFSSKIPVTPGKTYGMRAYTDSRNFKTGEVGFYIDEYNKAGNWISGKWFGAIYGPNVTDKPYAYTPTSANVATAAMQVYMSPGTTGAVYIDNVEFFAK